VNIEADPELYRELAALFLQEFPRMDSELKAAVGRRDSKGIEFSAHEIKGALAQFGAKEAADAALVLELKGRNKDFSGLEENLGTLERAAQPFLERLRALK
jgi:HPt (histidine-containing phosphotransfer) domain-containing protein